MTLRVVHLIINCGKKSCVSKDGTCSFLSSRLLGAIPTCTLFSTDLTADDQRNEGKPERCAECVERER